MATTNRAQLLTRLQKAVKKAYKPTPVPTDRSVMEHLLFACLLEDAHHQSAEDAFAAVTDAFFDWNEVRVTTIGELAEVMPMLPDPTAAARRLRETLQSVFESVYAFDLEPWRKLNLGHAVKRLERLKGTTAFSVGYVMRMALGGHTIPVSRSTLAALQVAGVVSDKDVANGVVPGLERAVSKSKGIEFASLLHQLGADFFANPYSAAVHAVLLEISPECKDNLPKKLTKRQREALQKKHEREEAKAEAREARASVATRGKESVEKSAAKQREPAKKVPAEKLAPQKAAARTHATAATKSAGKKTATKKIKSARAGKPRSKTAATVRRVTTKKSRGAPRKPR